LTLEALPLKLEVAGGRIMPEITAQEALEAGKNLDFSQVWAGFLKLQEQQAVTDAQIRQLSGKTDEQIRKMAIKVDKTSDDVNKVSCDVGKIVKNQGRLVE
jgi:TolA-binding protein